MPSKSKSKPRPPRIFIRGNKLYIQVGKRKLLIKDADKYRRSDILDILIEQLLVRRKRRKKGKITKREKRLNREDLRIFNEFEKMNKNQSKGSLKIPLVDKQKLNLLKNSSKESLFFNAMLQFLKTIPKKDVNIEVKKQTIKEQSKPSSKSEKPLAVSSGTQISPTPISGGTQASFNDPNLVIQIEKLQADGKLKDLTIDKQKKVGVLLSDLNNFDRSGNKNKSKKILKKWQERFELNSGTRMDLGVNSKGAKRSWNTIKPKEYFEIIIDAYGGLDNVDMIYTDYQQYRPELFPEKKEEKVEVEEIEDVSGDSSDSGTNNEEFNKFLEDTEDAKGQVEEPESESSDDEVASAGEAVIAQIANGASYTGQGLTTGQIDNMLKPILKSRYLGTLPADFNRFLPNLKNNKRFGFVMNTDPSNKEGKHWIAVLVDMEDDMSVEYYDSFGREPSKKFMKELKKLIDKLKPSTYLKMKTNNIQVQNKNSQNCGWFAMKFLLDRLKMGKTFKDSTGYAQPIVDDSENGEFNINQLKNKFGYI